MINQLLYEIIKFKELNGETATIKNMKVIY